MAYSGDTLYNLMETLFIVVAPKYACAAGAHAQLFVRTRARAINNRPDYHAAAVPRREKSFLSVVVAWLCKGILRVLCVYSISGCLDAPIGINGFQDRLHGTNARGGGNVGRVCLGEMYLLLQRLYVGMFDLCLESVCEGSSVGQWRLC